MNLKYLFLILIIIGLFVGVGFLIYKNFYESKSEDLDLNSNNFYKTEEHNLPINNEPKQAYIEQTKKQECVDGQTISCVDEKNCPGKKTCVLGTWLNCYVERICTPKEKKICALGDGCNFGYKECNECGTGWSECKRG